MTDPQNPRQGAHFHAADLGPASGWKDYRYFHPKMGREVRGKFFLREPLALTGAEISINSLPPGAAIPFYHKHRENEEIYFFLGGSGEMQVDGEVIPVREASRESAKSPPGSAGGERTWRVTGGESLTYLVMQVKAGSQAIGTIDDGERIDKPVEW